MFNDDDYSLSAEQKEYFRSVERSKRIIKIIRILYVVVVLPVFIFSFFYPIAFFIAFFLLFVFAMINVIHKNNIK